MKYCSVAQMATRWQLSERTVRNYCAKGKIEGAFLTGKTWNIPETAQKPLRKKRSKKSENNLLAVLQREKESKLSGGIYNPPYSPTGKALIERFFHTMKMRFMDIHKGSDYHSLGQLNDDLNKWINE